MEIRIFGYPSYANYDGIWIKGSIDRVIEGEQVRSGDCNIKITPSVRAFNYHGCSGSPLVHDDKFVGIILEQESQKGEAELINAIDNSLFKDYLLENGIICDPDSKSPQLNNSTSVESDSMLASKNIPSTNVSVEKLDETINKLLRYTLSGIINAHIVGDDSNGIIKLLEIVNSEEYQSDVHYWQFFYQAAVWLCDKQDKQAEIYYAIAKKLNTKLDDRLYRAGQLVNAGNFDLAEQVLSPIDTAAVLAELLALKYKQGNGAEADNIMLSAKIMPDSAVNNSLALCYLQMRRFDDAIETVKKLTDTHPKSILCWYLTGLVYYWKAVSNYTDLIPCDRLLIFRGKALPLSEDILKEASSALDCFEKALSLCAPYENKTWKGVLLSACLLSKWILKHDDTKSFCNSILLRAPANAEAVFYANEHGIQLPKKCIDALVSTANSSENSGFEAAVYIDYLIRHNNIAKADEEFLRFSTKIKTYSDDHYFELSFLIPARQGKIHKAKQIIECSQISTIEKKRARLRLAQYDKKASQKTSINIAGVFQNETDFVDKLKKQQPGTHHSLGC